jgi:hypothetical protein
VFPLPPKDPPSKEIPASPPISWKLPLVAGGLALLLLPLFTRVKQWDRSGDVRVMGRVVIAETGAPLAGARLLTLSRAAVALDEAEIAEQRALSEEERRERFPCSTWPWATGVTDAHGRFDLCLEIGWGGTDYFRCATGSHEAPKYQFVRALLVEWGEGRRQVIDATSGDWIVHRPWRRGSLYATLDLGDVTVDR